MGRGEGTMRSRTALHAALTIVLTACLLGAAVGPVAAVENCPDETAADCGLDDDPERDGLYDGPDYDLGNETDVNALSEWALSRPDALIGL